MTSRISRDFKTGFSEKWLTRSIEYPKRARESHYTFPRTWLRCPATKVKVGKMPQNRTFQNVSPLSDLIGEERNSLQSKETICLHRTCSSKFWIFDHGADYDVTIVVKVETRFTAKMPLGCCSLHKMSPCFAFHFSRISTPLPSNGRQRLKPCTAQNASPPSVCIGSEQNQAQSGKVGYTIKTYFPEFWYMRRGAVYDVILIGGFGEKWNLSWHRQVRCRWKGHRT